MSDTYVCAGCGDENVKGLDDSEAVAEFEARFGRKPDPENDLLICDDCHEILMKWMRTRDMTKHQLLEWLSQEDASLYGECKGTLLDDLYHLGFVDIDEPPPGRSKDFARVRLTPLGFDELRRAEDSFRP